MNFGGSLPSPCQTVAQVFADLDQDSSGSVNLDEMTRGLRVVGIDFTDAEAIAFRKFCDTDNSGSISLSEFTAAVYQKGRGAGLR